MTRAALIRTIFLMMYCPSKVRTKGKVTNTAVGLRKIGEIAPPICRNMSRMVRRINLPVINPRPMIISQTARKGINRFIGRKGSDSRMSVSAGLAPGMSLSAPNQKKTTPMETRSKTVLRVLDPAY